ncbi:hypothetical protein [Methylobacterium aquaticum]|uniref:hypothetical protein n=1 Tax=Methylobacterium aquaticum TaxID=270351 RepID=UPI00193423DE|nr:hypothetical protein [Methylobacterium aquaticum]
MRLCAVVARRRHSGSAPRRSAADSWSSTLGGLCDYLMVRAATTEPLTAEGAAVSRLALVEIVAVYGTTDPLN